LQEWTLSKDEKRAWTLYEWTLTEDIAGWTLQEWTVVEEIA